MNIREGTRIIGIMLGVSLLLLLIIWQLMSIVFDTVNEIQDIGSFNEVQPLESLHVLKNVSIIFIKDGQRVKVEGWFEANDSQDN